MGGREHGGTVMIPCLVCFVFSLCPICPLGGVADPSVVLASSTPTENPLTGLFSSQDKLPGVRLFCHC